MSESSSKRPPHAPVAETQRATASATAAAIDEAAATPPAPRTVPAPARRGSPVTAPDPVALFDALAHGAEAFADEMTELAQSGLANASETAKAMLGAKTFTEAFEINAGFFHKSLDTMLSGSLRLSDIAARLAEETLQPLAPAR